MTFLHKEIDKKISQYDLNDLAKNCGYNNVQKGANKIKNILKNSYFGLLDNTGYDLVHSNQSLLLKLCEVLEIPNEVYEKELYAIYRINSFYTRAKYKHIKIFTKFDKGSQNSMGLMYLARQRTIRNLHSLEKLDFTNQLNKVSKLVKNNYSDNKGKLKGLGNIVAYGYCYEEGREPYLFNPKGEIIEEIDWNFDNKYNLKPFYHTQAIGENMTQCQSWIKFLEDKSSKTATVETVQDAIKNGDIVTENAFGTRNELSLSLAKIHSKCLDIEYKLLGLLLLDGFQFETLDGFKKEIRNQSFTEKITNPEINEILAVFERFDSYCNKIYFAITYIENFFADVFYEKEKE